LELLAKDFIDVNSMLSHETSVFLFATSGVLADVVQAVRRYSKALDELGSQSGRRWSLRRFLLVGSKHFGVSLLDRSATHPRFVVCNTLSISFAFLVGWHGLWNILPAYSSYPASTICVIVYTYAGSSGSITTRRVAGVVLGKVTGTAFQLGFAVKD
jgi:hypothetical protein